MLAALALADVALGRKEESIQEARRAMEMRPISEDAEDGPCIAANVAVVYAWANQSDFAFEQLNILIKRTSYLLVTYGNLKTNPSWDPLRKDPRVEKLLAQLAPNQSLQKPRSSAPRVRTHNPSVRCGPQKISVATFPLTGSDLFALLD